MCSSLLNGKALLTIATGDIGEAEAERAGLVPTHAYAVLDMREIRGKRLLKLKNPWSRVSWRGHYSPHHPEVGALDADGQHGCATLKRERS